VQSVMVLLKEAVALNPENIEAQIRLGTVILFYEKELGIPAKQASLQWLQALKAQQTNPDIYYCLAIYYHFVEKDHVKALKLIDKVLLLKPDHEDGSILYFQILNEKGALSQAYTMIESVQKVNPLLAYPYYFLGVRA